MGRPPLLAAAPPLLLGAREPRTGVRAEHNRGASGESDKRRDPAEAVREVGPDRTPGARDLRVARLGYAHRRCRRGGSGRERKTQQKPPKEPVSLSECHLSTPPVH